MSVYPPSFMLQLSCTSHLHTLKFLTDNDWQIFTITCLYILKSLREKELLHYFYPDIYHLWPIITIYVALCSWSFKLPSVWRTSFSNSLRAVLWLWILCCCCCFHLRMSLFHFHSWRIFSLGIEVCTDSSFLSIP